MSNTIQFYLVKTFHHSLLILALILTATHTWAQEALTPPLLEKGASTAQYEPSADVSASVQPSAAVSRGKQKLVIITGVRFAYPLIQKWIDDYNNVSKDVQLVIESRGSSDPAKYDILVEAYEPNEGTKRNRDFVYVARYAILPIANNKSEFAKTYASKGLNKELISQLYFHNIYADKDKEQAIRVPYTIYTRLQKAGSPIIFAKYFGYEQKDVKGKAIAGADEHLLKALLRDSTGVSYLPLSLIYDRTSKKPVDGIAVLPVDLNGNGKISDDEKFYGDLPTVLQQLEERPAKDINNIPVEYINLSIEKNSGNPEAIEFLKWIIQNGQKDLHDFGYLKPEPSRFEAEKFEWFDSKSPK